MISSASVLSRQMTNMMPGFGVMRGVYFAVRIAGGDPGWKVIEKRIFTGIESADDHHCFGSRRNHLLLAQFKTLEFRRHFACVHQLQAESRLRRNLNAARGNMPIPELDPEGRLVASQCRKGSGGQYEDSAQNREYLILGHIIPLSNFPSCQLRHRRSDTPP